MYRVKRVTPILTAALAVACLVGGCRSLWTGINRLGAGVDSLQVGAAELAGFPREISTSFPVTVGDLHVGFVARGLVDPDTFNLILTHHGLHGPDPVLSQSVQAGGNKKHAYVRVTRPDRGWQQGAYEIDVYLGTKRVAGTAFTIGKMSVAVSPGAKPRTRRDQKAPPPRKGKVVYAEPVIATPGKATTIHCTEDLAVTLPPKLVLGNKTLTVKTLSVSAGSFPAGFKPIQAYEISLGKVHTFKHALTLTLKRPDLPKDAHVVGATWDARRKVWTPLPAVRDNVGTFSITTTHLSSWAWLQYERFHKGNAWGYYVRKGIHFTIYLDKKAKIPESLIPKDGTAFKPIRKFQSEAPTMSIDEIRGRIFLELVHDALVTARKSYKQHFKVPDKVTVTCRTTETSRWKWFTPHQSIVIAVNECGSPQELRQNAGHELFHAVQNQTEWLSSMIRWHWLMEAVADYAGDRVAQRSGSRHLFEGFALELMDFPRDFRKAWREPRTGRMGPEIRRTFIKDPLTLSNGVHDYEVAHLLWYLCDSPYLKRTGGFESLWYGVTRAKASMGAMPYLAFWSRLFGPGPLGKVYPRFAAFLLFSKDSPVMNRDNGSGLPSFKKYETDGYYVVKADAPANHTFSLPSPLTAGIAGLRVEFTEDDKQDRVDRKELRIEMHRVPGATTAERVECFLIPYNQRQLPVLRKGQPRPDAVIGADGKPFVVLTVKPEHIVYVVASNTDLERPVLTSLTASLAGTGILNMTHHREQMGLYQFGFKPGDLPRQRNLAFDWDFGDGSKKVTTDKPIQQHRFRRPGVHTVKAIARDRDTGEVLVTATLELPVATVHFNVIRADTRRPVPHGHLAIQRRGDNVYERVFGDNRRGRGTFFGVPPGTYAWRVRARNYQEASFTTPLEINPADKAVTTVNVALTPIPEPVATPKPRRDEEWKPKRDDRREPPTQPERKDPPKPDRRSKQEIRDDYAARIKALRNEGNAILQKILKHLRTKVERKPIMHTCENKKCKDGGPHPWMQYLNGWECRKCITTLRPQKDLPTPHGVYNEVFRRYKARITALERERDARLASRRQGK
jgi:hypothetical protein